MESRNFWGANFWMKIWGANLLSRKYSLGVGGGGATLESKFWTSKFVWEQIFADEIWEAKNFWRNLCK